MVRAGKPVESSFDSWEEGVPLYRVAGVADARVFVGTDYPVECAESTLVVKAYFTGEFSGRLVRAVCRAVVAKMRPVVVDLQAGAALHRLEPDAPLDLPRDSIAGRGIACFWFCPPARDSAKPLLAMRFRYNAALVERVRGLVGSKRIGGWLPDYRVWYVKRWEAIPRVLGELQAAGVPLTWVSRQGFPAAPHIEVVAARGCPTCGAVKGGES